MDPASSACASPPDGSSSLNTEAMRTTNLPSGIPPATAGHSSASRLGAALVLLLALAAPAAATVRYASPSGLDSNSGTSPSSPWTLSKANSSLVAGDVCVLLPGTYTTSVNPANLGTDNRTRITYLGDLSNPGATVVPSIQPSKAYITVKGISANGAITLAYPASYDSVAYCIAKGIGFYAAKRCMVARNTINGLVYFAANDGLPCYTGQNLDTRCFANSEYDTLRGNRIDFGVIVPGTVCLTFKAWTQHCLIDSNSASGRFDATGSSSTAGAGGFASYNSYYQTFRDNRWAYDAGSASPTGNWAAMYLRDSLHTTLFERDTVLGAVNNPAYRVISVMSASGSFPNSVRNITLKSCVIRVSGDIWWENGVDTWTMDGCVLASGAGMPFFVASDWTGSKLRHSTVWGTAGAGRFEGCSTCNLFKGTGNELTSNIFYSQSAWPLGNWGGVFHFKESTTGFTSNNNLFFAPNFDSAPGDRSLMWAGYYESQPGAGKPWNLMNGQDGNSKYGSPLFVDSTFANLDPHLRLGSPAIGLGAGGTDAGAYPFVSAGPDTTPPGGVISLGVALTSDSVVVLTWTAPGDDGMTGTAAAYDLRWSTQPITAAGFGSATPVPIQPGPLPAGTAQSYVAVGLTPGTSYYFALKASDEAGNWSPMSNVANATTALTDKVPPAATHDLGIP